MNDLSFIRLLPNIYDAIFQEVSQGASLLENYQQIVISPKSFYLQKSNVLGNGIAFDNNVEVTLVDLCGNLVQNITENVSITEVIDENGIPQIYFEILNIGVDYYSTPLLIKFKHTVSFFEWFSNPILVTDSITTTEFEYKNVSDLYYQSIGLACYFSTFDAEAESETYTTYDGKKRTSRLINTEFRKYTFDDCSNFAYRRLNELLSSNILYANGFLVTDKQTLASEDRQGDTDLFNLEFSLASDFSETKSKELQIFEPFAYSVVAPKDETTLPITQLSGTLNRACTLQTGTILLYKNNTLIGTFTQANVVLSGVNFTISTGLITDLDTYNVRVSKGLFKSILNEQSPAVNDWQFTTMAGEFDGTQFTNEFLIN